MILIQYPELLCLEGKIYMKDIKVIQPSMCVTLSEDYKDSGRLFKQMKLIS